MGVSECECVCEYVFVLVSGCEYMCVWGGHVCLCVCISM